MTWSATLDYLYNRLPMFQRTGPAAYKGSLNNTIALCEHLGNPQNKFKTIHIAGTNGKGSTSHLIASVFQEAGLKTGLYTSPHLKDFRERVKINGKEISEQYTIDFVEKNKDFFERINPSFFEMTVALAFNYFADSKVDIAVIETGLGGRLDSTNIITPLLSVITNISNDHANLLGDTLEKIATEKAGIIKPRIPVIIGETQEDIKHVFDTIAIKRDAPIFYADQEFKAQNIEKLNETQPLLKLDLSSVNKSYTNLYCPLTGNYQKKNLATVINTLDYLAEHYFIINPEHIKDGIYNVIKNTGLKGRWEILSKEPLCICDSGHNESGISYVMEQIEQTPHKHLHIVLGVVSDKEIDKILKKFPRNATYYFCRANIPRALNEKELQQKALQFGLSGETYSTVKEAYHTAQRSAGKDDLVFVGGSTFVVAEVV